MTNEMTYDKKYHFLDSFSVFMDIDSMRELFGKDDNYYNMLLSEKHKSERVYSLSLLKFIKGLLTCIF